MDAINAVSLSKFVQKLIETKLSKYCQDKMSGHTRQVVRLEYKINENYVTLFEIRPLNVSTWIGNPVVRFLFNDDTKKWDMHYFDSEQECWPYINVDSNANLDELLKEVDRDPTGVFWG